MNSSRIQTGDTEPVVAVVLSLSGERLTGKTDIKAKIRRLSDDQFFDWDDNTFKSPDLVVQLLETLSEVSSTYSPGVYQLDTANHQNGFDTSVISNAEENDTYYVTAVQDGGTDAANLPLDGEIKVGQYVDDLKIILGLVQSNFFLDQTIYNGAGLLTSGRIRIFPDKTTTDSATDGGAGEGELASFQVTSVAEPVPAESLPATYKVTRES
jgi:hypothetical protein